MSELKKLLSEALDLCVRARKMDAQDRTNTALEISASPENWERTGGFAKYVERHNITHPETPMLPRSAAVPMWIQDQYERDLHDWEQRARVALKKDTTHG